MTETVPILRYGEILERRAARQPHVVAIVHDGVEVTYGALLERIVEIHSALLASGVQPGDRIACYSENHPDLLASLFACTRLGAIYTPIGAAATTEEAQAIITDLAARLVLTSELMRARADGITGVPVLALADPLPGGGPVVAYALEDPSDTALVIYTSGTSGRPKGVEMTHAALFYNTINNVLGMDFASDDVALVFTPLSHAAALTTLAGTTLHKGGTVVLESRFDADRSLELIETRRITMMFAVPATLAMLSRSPRFAATDLSSLRWVLGGGAAFSPAQIEFWSGLGVPVLASFGMTEAGPSVSFRRKGDAATKATSSGTAAMLSEVRIVDEDSRELPQGEVGEVEVRGPSVASRYWRNPEATAATFAAGWLHTGDRGYLDEDGELCVTGRSKDIIITGGENVDPVEVEHAVAQFPGVKEAAVVGRADGTWGELVTAVVVADEPIDLDELKAFLAPKLGRFKIPRALEYRESLPRNAMGKVMRTEL